MSRYPKPAEGSWTGHHPELGTALVSYDDCISTDTFELERTKLDCVHEPVP